MIRVTALRPVGHGLPVSCGASGDVLDYIQRAHDVDLREAAAMLDGGNIPVVVQPALPPMPERDTTADAIEIWRSSGPIGGSKFRGDP